VVETEEPAYVVSRPDRGSGLGSNLASLAGAIWLARRLGRRVVVDWRDMLELRDKTANYMPEFLETPDEIMGVRVYYAPAEEIADYPAAETESCAWFSPPSLAAAVRDGSAPCEKYAVLELYHGLDRLDPHGDVFARHEFMRRFYRSVRPADHIRAKLDEWRDEHFGERFVVGVNIRTGNGQFEKGSLYYRRVDPHVVRHHETLVRKLIAAVERSIRRLPRPLREGSKTFYVTDCTSMHETLSRLPRAITRRTVFPPAGAGHQFADFTPETYGAYTDRTSIEDTIIDMFLLASCNALVYNPTLFSEYARVTTNYFGGNLINVESRYARYYVRVAKAVYGSRGPAPVPQTVGKSNL
jgi:Nodulation protein Z (NodZ)